MRVIDCDAHVEESVESWQYLDPEYYLLRPIPVVFPEDTCFGTHNAAWVIDYKLRYFASNPTLMKRAQGQGRVHTGAGDARYQTAAGPYGRIGHRRPGGLSLSLARLPRGKR